MPTGTPVRSLGQGYPTLERTRTGVPPGQGKDGVPPWTVSCHWSCWKSCQGEGGTPVKPDAGGEGTPVSSQVLGQGYQSPPPPPPQAEHATDRIRRGKYASCGHAGGLSCWEHVPDEFELPVQANSQDKCYLMALDMELGNRIRDKSMIYNFVCMNFQNRNSKYIIFSKYRSNLFHLLYNYMHYL